ncbi:MAG TPA: L-seryl-tRNA(Sec) selenium transferase [Candidatus Limnocylindrales bacterium]|nr:L-seryl-tRNA(Sec) selenium transferase [Candidatus Limnocylindrales bacterium]
MDDPRRLTPRIDALLEDRRLASASERLGRAYVREVVRRVVARVRAGELAPEAAMHQVLSELPSAPTSLRPVINATGVIVHTNLGRAPLSHAALEAIVLASGPTDVEFDLESGHRAPRGQRALAAMLRAVPGAEAMHVVNNNAAALALVAAALAPGLEIVVSRGELVEIGDGFRLPELLESAGAKLREVGTTNRTHLADYERAIGPSTALVLKIHPSNFMMTGFTSTVPVAALKTLGVPVVYDIGSGLPAPEPLLPGEPDVATALRDGADLVTASGDKLLGGPQAGLLFGRSELVQRLRRHPLARAMRVDKLTLAALEATVCGPESPVTSFLRADLDSLERRASYMAESLRGRGIDVVVVASEAAVGGGGAPGVVMASVALSLPRYFAERLRHSTPAVVGRVAGDRCLVDLRTVPPSDDEALKANIMICATTQ